MRLETQLQDLRTSTAVCLKCMVCTYGKWPDNHPLCALYENHRTYTASPGGLIYLIKALSENWTGLTPEMAELAYECTLCETCDMCEIIPVPPPHTTPSDLIRFLRYLLVKNGMMPEKIRGLQDKLKKPALSEKKVESKSREDGAHMAKTVLFVDGSSSAEKKLSQHAVSLLSKMGSNATIMDRSGATSGSDLYDLGLWDELKEEIERNAGEMAKLEGKEVIFLNPHTQEFLTRKYADFSSSSPAIKGRHFSELLRDAFKKGKLKALKGKKMKIAYHDPCRLSRGLGTHAAPRDVLKAINLEVIEMKRNREETYCCGAGSVNPAYGGFAEIVAGERIKEFLETGAEVLVTACPYCEEVFSGLLKGENGKVRDLLEVVDERTQKVS